MKKAVLITSAIVLAIVLTGCKSKEEKEFEQVANQIYNEMDAEGQAEMNEFAEAISDEYESDMQRKEEQEAELQASDISVLNDVQQVTLGSAEFDGKQYTLSIPISNKYEVLIQSIDEKIKVLEENKANNSFTSTNLKNDEVNGIKIDMDYSLGGESEREDGSKKYDISFKAEGDPQTDFTIDTWKEFKEKDYSYGNYSTLETFESKDTDIQIMGVKCYMDYQYQVDNYYAAIRLTGRLSIDAFLPDKATVSEYGEYTIPQVLGLRIDIESKKQYTDEQEYEKDRQQLEDYFNLVIDQMEIIEGEAEKPESVELQSLSIEAQHQLSAFIASLDYNNTDIFNSDAENALWILFQYQDDIHPAYFSNEDDLPDILGSYEVTKNGFNKFFEESWGMKIPEDFDYQAGNGDYHLEISESGGLESNVDGSLMLVRGGDVEIVSYENDIYTLKGSFGHGEMGDESINQEKTFTATAVYNEKSIYDGLQITSFTVTD